MSNNPTIANKIPINRVPASEMIHDTQSAIQAGLNDFQDSGMLADASLMRDDSELSRNPNIQAAPKKSYKTSHADQLNQDISQHGGEIQETIEPVRGDIETTSSEQSVDQPIQERQTLQQPKQETQKEFNIRILRQKAEEAEERAARLENMLKQQQQYQQYQQPNQYQQQQYQQQVQPQEERINIEDDALIEGKQLKKYIQQLENKFTKNLQQVNRHAIESAAEARLKSQFSDFENVVSVENIKNFAAIYPEEYRSMQSNPDIYAQGKTAYTMIKNLGILDVNTPQPQRNYQDTDRRIANNLSRPRTASQVGSQPDSSTLGSLGSYSNGGRRVLSEADKQRVRENLKQKRQFSSY